MNHDLSSDNTRLVNPQLGDGALDVSRRAQIWQEELNQRQNKILEKLTIDSEKARIIAALFHVRFYSRYSGVEDLNWEVQLDHYLDTGIDHDLPPGPLVDTGFLSKKILDKRHQSVLDEQTEELPLILKWLNVIEHNLLVPSQIFDGSYYIKKYHDVRAAGMDPFLHFIFYGQNEGRFPLPCKEIPYLCEVFKQRFLCSSSFFSDFLSFFPDEFLTAEAISSVSNDLKDFFSVIFYRAQFSPELDELTKDELIIHYLATGMDKGARPSVLFNPEYYAHEFEKFCLENENSEGGCDSYVLRSLHAKLINPYVHWVLIGADYRVVPTPLFDQSYYEEKNIDLKKWKGWLFQHYITHGRNEKFRSPNEFFVPVQYLKQDTESDKKDYLNRYVVSDFSSELVPSGRLTTQCLLKLNSLSETSRLEYSIDKLRKKKDFERRPILQEMITKAEELEPLIGFPGGVKKTTLIPYVHDQIALYDYGMYCEEALEGVTADVMILMPHGRALSGASKNGFTFAKALSLAFPEKSILIVYTDFIEENPAQDFCQTFNFCEHVGSDVNPEIRQKTLLDIISCLKVSSVVTINSRLGWDLIVNYGQQMSTWCHLYAYLFCWDVNSEGKKSGYPVRELQLSFNFLTAVYFDTEYLKNEISERYLLSDRCKSKLHVLYAPAEEVKLDASKNITYRRQRGLPLRAAWAGRFDRQKRIDIVFDIMRNMPELELLMYGKSVLDDSEDLLSDAPLNIQFMGTFDDFSEIPFDDIDFFLYTSQWDGMPNIIVLAASYGLPIVASNVGGISELINENTGYLVDDIENVSSYVDQIKALLDEYSVASEKAKKLKSSVYEVCNLAKNAKIILQSFFVE